MLALEDDKTSAIRSMIRTLLVRAFMRRDNQLKMCDVIECEKPSKYGIDDVTIAFSRRKQP